MCVFVCVSVLCVFVRAHACMCVYAGVCVFSHAYSRFLTLISQSPLDVLITSHGSMILNAATSSFIARMRDLHQRAPDAAAAAAAAERKSIDFPVLAAFVLTATLAVLFQSVMMLRSNSAAVAAAIVFAAAPASLVYPHRLVWHPAVFDVMLLLSLLLLLLFVSVVLLLV